MKMKKRRDLLVCWSELVSCEVFSFFTFLREEEEEETDGEEDQSSKVKEREKEERRRRKWFNFWRGENKLVPVSFFNPITSSFLSSSSLQFRVYVLI